MDLSDIEMLEAIVRHGSISRASEVLHITQPTLSKRLSRLEFTLCTKLFDRSSSGLTPTAHTAFIIESSQLIKNKIRNIERHIELINMLEVGELRIGVGPIVERLYFPYALLELTKSRSTKLKLSIRTEKSDDLRDLLVDGLIDIAIGPFEQSSACDEYEIFPIASEPLMIALRAKHPLVKRSKEVQEMDPEEIFRYTLIAPHIPKYILTQYPPLADLGSARIICDNYSVIKEILIESDKISIGPSAVFSEEVKGNSMTLLPPPVPIRWYAACITRPETGCLPVIGKVIEIFRKYDLPSIDIAKP